MNEAITTLAANLYQSAVELAEEPLSGSGTYFTELGSRLATNSREQLHAFLVIHQSNLDESEWAMIRGASASEDNWQNFLS